MGKLRKEFLREFTTVTESGTYSSGIDPNEEIQIGYSGPTVVDTEWEHKIVIFPVIDLTEEKEK